MDINPHYKGGIQSPDLSVPDTGLAPARSEKSPVDEEQSPAIDPSTNDPGNEDPGSLMDDAQVPLIDPQGVQPALDDDAGLDPDQVLQR